MERRGGLPCSAEVKGEPSAFLPAAEDTQQNRAGRPGALAQAFERLLYSSAAAPALSPIPALPAPVTALTIQPSRPKSRRSATAPSAC